MCFLRPTKRVHVPCSVFFLFMSSLYNLVNHSCHSLLRTVFFVIGQLVNWSIGFFHCKTIINIEAKISKIEKHFCCKKF